MKKVLIVVMMLALTLAFYAGNAEAINGVADKVPGTDVAIPFFCDDGALGEDTLWAVASTAAQAGGYVVYEPDDSEAVWDNSASWTANDVISWNCVDLINTVSLAAKAALCSGGKCSGYIVYTGASGANTLVGWSYILNTTLGFAASGISLELENGAIGLSENIGQDPILANLMLPRWFILNSNAETKTNWIFLTGDDCAGSNITISGFICDEEEDCPSIPTTDLCEVTVIDVAYNFVPMSWQTGASIAGWAILSVFNPNNQTIVGLSHQKAQASTVMQTWDVSHEMHITRTGGAYLHVE